MDRFLIFKYLNRINENIVISFARNHNINMSYFEASQGLFFVRTHFDALYNCYDKKEYIYYYFQDPFAYKLYTLISIVRNKYNLF